MTYPYGVGTRKGAIMSTFKEKFFHDEEAAYAFVEGHIWPDGRICPHCGVIAKSGSGPLKGKSTRLGVYKCYACRKPYTVKVGTIFEASHIKLHIWLQAIFLMTSSKKGISSNQLHRTLGITLRSAWFMSHRIRAAMDPLFNSPGEARGESAFRHRREAVDLPNNSSVRANARQEES